MNPKLCIYEDEGYTDLYPLALTRPVFELRCGMFTLLEKIVGRFPGFPICYQIRDLLAEVVRERHPQTPVNRLERSDTYFINGRVILRQDLPVELEESVVFLAGQEVVGAFVRARDFAHLKTRDDGTIDSEAFRRFKSQPVNAEFIRYPWDLVHRNPTEIESDFRLSGSGGHIFGKVYPNVTLLEQANIYLAPGAALYPGVVIDGEAGPVYIAEGCKVMANAVIEGPAYIGRNSTIKIGAKIYGGTTLGEVCKVGGEVEGSIIHGFSNKQHEGFLGHAYLGEWVNLGADTNNSDLKNNYGSVKVFFGKRAVDTGSMFVGLFMGDHSKSGINTMFNTGTMVGVMCNIFGGGYPPKFLPSFTWGGVDRNERYQLEKALETAQRVMQRRKRELTPAQQTLYKTIYEMSESGEV